MRLLARVHRPIFDRRASVLSSHIARLLPPNASVLDVGCGDGQIDSLIMEQRPDVRIAGLDVLVRPSTAIPVQQFDGRRIPREDSSVDIVLLVDVLHHADDPMVLLEEARRVAHRSLVVKDHTRDGILAWLTLALMDWVGNAPHGVTRPHRYWAESQWDRAFERIGVHPAVCEKRLGLYPKPADWVFGRSLHFVARLDVTEKGGGVTEKGGGVDDVRF